MKLYDFDEDLLNGRHPFVRNIAHTLLGHYLVTKDSRWFAAFACSLIAWCLSFDLMLSALGLNSSILLSGEQSFFQQLHSSLTWMIIFFIASNYFAQRWPIALRFSALLALMLASSLIIP